MALTHLRFAIGSTLVIALSLSSCDRSDPLVTGTPIEQVKRPTVELRVLTQLPPNRITHLTVDQLGNIYWVQEDENAENVMLVIGEAGIPRITMLSSSNILKEMGISGGRGVIQDIRAAESAIWFYFIGGKGRASYSCLGQFFPRTSAIRIVARNKQLSDLSRMGVSLDLARGSLVVSGSTMWLWLRHSDLSTFLTFDLRDAQTGTVSLVRAFESVTSEGRAITLNREDLEISTGTDATLLLSDTKNGVLWEIDPFGRATTRVSLVGLPRALTPPLMLKDYLIMFSADSELIESRSIEPMSNLPRVQYPALLKFDRSEIRAIERDDLRAYSGFPVYAMRLQRLVREAPDRVVAYDAASGSLMRLTLPKQW